MGFESLNHRLATRMFRTCPLPTLPLIAFILVLVNLWAATRVIRKDSMDEYDASIALLSDASSSISLESVIEETTRLLYENSPEFGYWLQVPLPKIYIYDTLEKDWSDVGTISKCIESKFGIPSNWSSGCQWQPEVCDRIPVASLSDSKQESYLNYKSNYNTDVAYLDWFRGYKYLTTNATEADILLVPYPHKSHCLCRKDFSMGSAKCSYNVEEMREHVISKLTYFEDRRERHLFLAGADYKQCPLLFRKLAVPEFMSISLGQVRDCRNRPLCGHFVSPYMNFHSRYQPRQLQALSKDWWVSRKRSFSVGAAMSTPKHLKMRFELGSNLREYIPESISGLPTKMIMTGSSRIPPNETTILYQDSIFCPILPGDDAVQKRFFDVILSGCIPLVPVWEPSDEEGYPTFFQYKGRSSIRQTYPFHRGTFFGDDTVGIDYLRDMVVTFDGFCGLKCMAPAVESALQNRTEITRIRQNLWKYSRLFAFGLGENKYRSVDAFAGMLVSLRHYVESLKSSSLK